MKILLSSHRFAPSVGGIEQVSEILAEEFAALGHEVCIVTETAAAGPEPARPYRVFRQPGPGRLWALAGWCEVFLQNNISLSTLGPVWLRGRPTVVTCQTWVTQPDGGVGWRERLKGAAARRVRANIAISGAVAASLPAPSEVVPNPYRDDVFFADPAGRRERELIFVGRLVSDKGVDGLLDALATLRARGCAPRLTIVGGGPDEAALRAQAARTGLADQVVFAGVRQGAELRRELNAHAILVVPSRRPEPFGIVALEGMACGCAVVGSSGGGLPEAIGPGGKLFPNGDAGALAAVLEQLLREPSSGAGPRPGVEAHLARHRRRAVARRYLEILRAAMDR